MAKKNMIGIALLVSALAISSTALAASEQLFGICYGGNADIPPCMDLARASMSCDLNGDWAAFYNGKKRTLYRFERIFDYNGNHVYRASILIHGGKTVHEVGTLTQTQHGYFLFHRLKMQLPTGSKGQYKHTYFSLLTQSISNCNRMDEINNVSTKGPVKRTYYLARQLGNFGPGRPFPSPGGHNKPGGMIPKWGR